MNLASWIVLAIVAAIIVFAARATFFKKGGAGGCHDCHDCEAQAKCQHMMENLRIEDR